MQEAPRFTPGLEISRCFYWEAGRPILDRRFPDLPHAAARVGGGSDVLGFDTAMSTDHDWGPSVTILLRSDEANVAALGAAIRDALGHELQETFMGYAVGMEESPLEPGTLTMSATPRRPLHRHVGINHRGRD